MRRHALAALILLPTLGAAPEPPKAVSYPPPAEVRTAFLKLLDRPKVPPDVQAKEPVRSDDGLVTEELSIATERKADGSMERVPMLLVRPEKPVGRLAAVIMLHGTGGGKEGLRDWMTDLARAGIIGVAIDGRYHGQRVSNEARATAYNEAIVRAWRVPAGEPQEHPLYFDNCWDIWRTIDYLQSRPDVQPRRIGLLGISKGGIETWLAAAVDERVTVAVPAISMQSFRWSLEHEKWQGRAATIRAAHAAAAHDLGEPQVNARVCRALWDKVIPGMLDQFDGPSMIRLFAGRPLLVLNGELDPNCPIDGADQAFSAARAAFQEAGTPDLLKIVVARGVGHVVTPTLRVQALDWLRRWLKPQEEKSP